MAKNNKRKGERKGISFHESVLGSKEDYTTQVNNLLLMGYR